MSDAGWSWRELWRVAAAVSDSPQEGLMVKLEMHNVDPKEMFSSFDRTSFTFVRFGVFLLLVQSWSVKWESRVHSNIFPTFCFCEHSTSKCWWRFLFLEYIRTTVLESCQKSILLCLFLTAINGRYWENCLRTGQSQYALICSASLYSSYVTVLPCQKLFLMAFHEFSALFCAF